MESHNHPSYIEPYQGAATGVGGILRDVFTMGARPVANLNALRFGRPEHPKMKHLVKGVVAGIGGYGNCGGVPTVQVGDPFTEKLLIEACLELMASDAIVAIQDMGAAGLTSSSVEMATNGEVGIILDMDKVPCRETGMTAYEMMLSESQERMLMVLKPGREEMAEAIFTKWELDFAVIGEVTDTRRMALTHKGETVCDIPLGPLADDAPLYDRPHLTQEEYKAHVAIEPLGDIPESTDIGADLLKMMASPALASRRWIWEQYDSQVGADTAQRSGGDAAVVRVHGTNKGLAITTDCTPRYCKADPVEGGKQAIAEAYRNLTAVGAKPLATTDCMNFGNPEKPHIMAQFVGCIEGMTEACEALDMPIVSGNVSLYNETTGADGVSHAILPTPAIGAVGLIDDLDTMMTIGFKNDGDYIATIGFHYEELGQSLWMREIHGSEDGAPPTVDLKDESLTGRTVRQLIKDGKVTAVHDVSDGGLAVALAEMALAGNLGAEVQDMTSAFAFSEAQGRYIVTYRNEDDLDPEKVPFTKIGRVKGDALVLNGQAVPVANLREASDSFFRDWMKD
jgi:phosphoribosylformylglycinamidine synthase